MQTSGVRLYSPRTEDETAAAFDCLEELLRGLPAPSEHRELLAIHLAEGRRQAAVGLLPAVELPSAAYEALRAERSPVGLLAACLLIYLGADLFDNVCDDELPGAWDGRSRDEANLAAATMLAALPHYALEGVRPTIGEPAVASVREIFARALLEMSAGQLAAATPADDLTPSGARTSVERYAGAQFACYSESGAAAAGAGPDQRAFAAAFGHAIGCGMQITSDLGELCAPPPVHDLTTRKATVPLAHALAALDGSKRERLRQLVAVAADDTAVHAEVQELVREAGSIEYTALLVGVFRRRALAAAAGLGGSGDARERLVAMAERLSLTA